MRVAIDTTPLLTGHSKRGVGYYTRRLFESLKRVDQQNEYISFTQGQKLPDVDLIHYPYFDLFFLNLPLIKKKPTVVTLFDVIPLIFKKEYKVGLRGSLKLQINKYLLKKNVDKIITISNCSKADIQKHLKIKNEDIDITYLAADPIFKKIDNREKKETIRRKYKLPPKFILYVGDVNYNKNLPGLFQAMTKLSLPLVLVGESALNRDLPEVIYLQKLAAELEIKNRVVRTGYVPDEDLVYFYNLAICYIQPSFYEGFGLPMLEAMACGTPVVCSNISSLSEIGGDVAIYVDPGNVENIASGIQRCLKIGKSQKDKLIHQARKFSWEKTARETIRIYEKTSNN